ncbi:MAG: hypothetical protein PF588_05300, partial [Candidatus Kapabacteria bacterium]|nr:hypothetical protein [Candidatus Kapabacteria bacterium]
MKNILTILFLITISSVLLLSEEAVKSDSLTPKKYLFSYKIEFPQIEFNALQSTNEELLDLLPEDAEISKDFPVAPLYKLEMSIFNHKSSYFSILAFYHSAGSNIHYEDNTGELDFNISAKTYGFGFGYTKFLAKKSKPFDYGLNLETGMLNKFYRFESNVYVADKLDTKVNNFS